jgi:adenine-specific DNA-methyltransferase
MNVVVCGNFEDVMPSIPDESVDLIFTSPPYAVGKDYEPDGRFGILLRSLNICFRETERVLKRGGYAVFNFGDMIPGRDILDTDEPCEMPMGWVYWSFGLANGLMLQAQRVWQKEFAKITGGKQAISAPRPVQEFEHLYTFRKVGGGPQIVRNRQVSQRAVWSTVGEKAMDTKGHPAAFPEGLVERVLSVYTEEGDVVLDPFAGSGTVGLVARRMGRKFILIEKEPGYVDGIKDRLAPTGAVEDRVPPPESPSVLDLFGDPD